MRELPFLGAERVLLVERLLAAYDEVVASGSPRLMTLEAGSGWGKSRVVQELYRRLAAERQTSGFWPPSILGAVPEAERGSLESPGGRRKRMFPASFVAPEGSLPEWLWWGISATARQGGTPVNALAADLEQVERLREALLMRLAELHPDTSWSRVIRALRSEGVREVAWEAAEKGLEAALTAAAVATGPLGLLVLAGRMGWKHRDRLGRRSKADGSSGVEQADVRGEMARDTAGLLGRFAAAGIPVVVVLEDAHQADETLVDLLVQVLRNRQGPVLIVATAWPGTLDEEGRQANRLVTEVPAPSVERIRPTDLSELALEDRVALAAELLPAADAAQRLLLARKWSNPLALELGCGLQALAQLLEDGELTAAELDTLPTDVDGLYREMWGELPEEVRRALMLAVLATPATVSGRLFDDRRWDVDLPVAAAVGLEWLEVEADGLRTRLVEDATAYDWVRRVDDWLQVCHEPAHHQVAADAALDPGAFSRTRRKAYYQALADAIVLDEAPEGLSDRQKAQARLLVSLAFEGFIDWTDTAITAADLLLAELSDASDTASLRTLAAIGDAMPATSDEAGLERRLMVAVALGELGQLATAIDRTRSAIAEHTRVLGAEHPRTLAARNSLAVWIGESGRVTEATEQFVQLLEDQVRILGADDANTLFTWSNLIGLLGASGRAEEAVEQLSGLLEQRVRVLGPYHRSTLNTRNSLALAVARSGRVEEAVERLGRLLEEQVRVLGADHPDTLTTRNNLASWLGRSGRVEEAVDQLTRLLDDQVRVLGADHPGTLSTRGILAIEVQKSGRPDEALHRLEGLLEDQVRVLGQDHRDTLFTRYAVILALWTTGREGEAADRLAQLIEVCRKFLGDDDELTRDATELLERWSST